MPMWLSLYFKFAWHQGQVGFIVHHGWVLFLLQDVDVFESEVMVVI